MMQFSCLAAALFVVWGFTPAGGAGVGISVVSSHVIADGRGGFAPIDALLSTAQFGQGVAMMGDVNFDNIPDLAVGAPDVCGGTETGGAYVLYLDNSTMVSGSMIHSFNGEGSGDCVGYSVASGASPGLVDDIVLGAPFGKSSSSLGGEVWNTFSSAGTKLISTDFPGGFLTTGDHMGDSVAVLDIGTNGVRDVVIGLARRNSARGALLVLFGLLVDTKSFDSYIEIQPSGLLDIGDLFGNAVCAMDDINGDSIPDLAVGAVGDADSGNIIGAVWILFLNNDGRIKGQQKINTVHGNFGGALSAGDRFGASVAKLPDLDGDGIAELAVGATGDDTDGADAGALWIVFLNSFGTVRMEHKITGINESTAGAEFGRSVTLLSYSNSAGTGIMKIAVGAPKISSGYVFIVTLEITAITATTATIVTTTTTATAATSTFTVAPSIVTGTAVITTSSTSTSASTITTTTGTSVSTPTSTSQAGVGGTSDYTTSASVSLPTSSSASVSGTLSAETLTSGELESGSPTGGAVPVVVVATVVGTLFLCACLAIGFVLVRCRARAQPDEQLPITSTSEDAAISLDEGFVPANSQSSTANPYGTTPANKSAANPYGRTLAKKVPKPKSSEASQYGRTPAKKVPKSILKSNENAYGKIPIAAMELGVVYHATPSFVESGKKQKQAAIASRELLWGPELGRGSYGVVFDALWNKRRVAVKVITEVSKAALAEFEKEATIMQAVEEHENVVRLLGVCHEPYALVQEFVELGSLDVWLPKHWEELSAENVLLIIAGIARGMEHLHAANIIHRDLAARNILLGKNYCAKVADFGQARQNTSDNTTKTETGPLKWMAPEAVMDHVYSVSTDVFSFGITIIEIYTRQLPYPGMTGVDAAAQVASGKLTHEMPTNAPPEIQSIINNCLSFQPEDRPTFTTIAAEVAALM